VVASAFNPVWLGVTTPDRCVAVMPATDTGTVVGRVVSPATLVGTLVVVLSGTVVVVSGTVVVVDVDVVVVVVQFTEFEPPSSRQAVAADDDRSPADTAAPAAGAARNAPPAMMTASAATRVGMGVRVRCCIPTCRAGRRANEGLA
jgi:hypothetical protein